MKKELGKINSVRFGLGGYQDAMFGLSLSFTFKGGGVNTFEGGTWDCETMVCDSYCKWTEADRSKHNDELIRKVSKYLKQGKVDDVTKLKGLPVELVFDQEHFGTLKSWRILEEVL